MDILLAGQISCMSLWDKLLDTVELTSFTWRARLNSSRSICRSLPATIENCCSNQASHFASLSILCE